MVHRAIAGRVYKEQYGIGAGVSSISEDRIYKRERVFERMKHPNHKYRQDDHLVLKELKESLDRCIEKIDEQK